MAGRHYLQKESVSDLIMDLLDDIGVISDIEQCAMGSKTS